MAAPRDADTVRAGPALSCAGLLVFLPLVWPAHTLPVPSFDAEWLAALLGCLLVLAITRVRAPLQVPGIARAPLLLAAVVALQYAGGLLPYGANALLVVLILVWAAALAAAGRTLVAVTGAALGAWLAWALLAAGLLNAAIGLLQTRRWESVLGVLAAPAPLLISDGAYGNLAQQNHYAAVLGFAVAALAYLVGSARLGWRLALPLGLVLLAGLMLSGSRSGLLFIAWTGLMIWANRSGPARWSRLRQLATVIALAVALGALFLAAHAGLLGWSLARLAHATQGLAPRRFLWLHALRMTLAHPVLGVGVDGFAAALVQQLEPDETIYGIDQYPHNLLLQVAADCGLAGLAAVLLPLVALLWRARRLAPGPWRMLLWSLLGIIGLHSMLEQPLAYLYFLGPAALLCGALDSTARRLPRAPVLGAGLLGLGVVLVTGHDYRQLQDTFYGAAKPAPQQRLAVARRLGQASLFAPLAELVAPEAFVPADAPVAQRLALSSRVVHFAPVAETTYRHAVLLAEAGQQAAAERQLRQALLAYPDAAEGYLQRIALLAQRDPATFGPLAAYARQLGYRLD